MVLLPAPGSPQSPSRSDKILNNGPLLGLFGSLLTAICAFIGVVVAQPTAAPTDCPAVWSRIVNLYDQQPYAVEQLADSYSGATAYTCQLNSFIDNLRPSDQTQQGIPASPT